MIFFIAQTPSENMAAFALDPCESCLAEAANAAKADFTRSSERTSVSTQLGCSAQFYGK